MRALRASFSSRARRAISLTASNSSRSNNVEVAQEALRLAAEQRLELAPNALRNAGGVVHQPGDLVEEPVRRLHHDCLRTFPAEQARQLRLPCPQTMAMVRPSRKWRRAAR